MKRCCLLLGACSLSFAPLFAFDAHAADTPFFEGTLFGGYRFGGSFTDGTDPNKGERKLTDAATYGATINLKSGDEGYYEFIYSKQTATVKGRLPTLTLPGTTPFDLSIEYFQVGGLLDLGDPNARTIPYVALTVGATRLNPQSADRDSASAVSVSIAGGLKFPVTDHIALRTEARAFISALSADSTIFCASGSSGSGCDILIHGGAFIQVQGTVGITMRF